MVGSSLFVTYRQLPKGYARSLTPPPKAPISPRPAATLALLRQEGEQLQVLLLKRSSLTRFIPGAYVFPGGRVDRVDGSEEILDHLAGPEKRYASQRTHDSGQPPGSELKLPARASLIAALRETLEEAGILFAEGGPRSFPMEGGHPGSRLRRDLHEQERPFHSVLASMKVKLDARHLAYIGHWMTPVQERYRYDTRFFGAEVPAGCPAFPDGKEMVEAIWLSPREALERNQKGTLPMVFPTILTLEALSAFSSAGEALGELGSQKVTRLLPTVEDTGTGVRAEFGEAHP